MKTFLLVENYTPEIVFSPDIERPITSKILIVDKCFVGILCDSPEGACFINAMDWEELQKSFWICTAYRFSFPNLREAIEAATHGDEELAQNILHAWYNN